MSYRKSRACPSCAAPMHHQDFGRLPEGTVGLDLCFDCHGIWFDQYESAQLTPGAILDLFRVIHDHQGKPARPVADSARCPICRARLQETRDIQRTNRITYHRCTAGHGRFTTFFQFLREKNFVRSLSKAEVEHLRVSIAQVRCSSCGASVDLARDPQCSYCRAPISILDADAVKRTVAELDDKERLRRQVNPAAVAEALIASGSFERKHARTERRPAWDTEVVDLVEEALGFLMDT